MCTKHYACDCLIYKRSLTSERTRKNLYVYHIRLWIITLSNNFVRPFSIIIDLKWKVVKRNRIRQLVISSSIVWRGPQWSFDHNSNIFWLIKCELLITHNDPCNNTISIPFRLHIVIWQHCWLIIPAHRGKAAN